MTMVVTIRVKWGRRVLISAREVRIPGEWCVPSEPGVGIVGTGMCWKWMSDDPGAGDRASVTDGVRMLAPSISAVVGRFYGFSGSRRFAARAGGNGGPRPDASGAWSRRESD